MNYLDGNYYVEVKDRRYKIHPNAKNLLRRRDEPNSLRTQYQVQNEIQIRKNQKVIRNDNNDLVVKNYAKTKQPIQQQLKFNSLDCPSCRRNNWLQFDKGFYCQNCEVLINKQKHQINKKVLGQDHYFPTRLFHANEKIREIYYSMVNTTYNSTDDMINKLQQLKGRTKLKTIKI